MLTTRKSGAGRSRKLSPIKKQPKSYAIQSKLKKRSPTIPQNIQKAMPFILICCFITLLIVYNLVGASIFPTNTLDSISNPEELNIAIVILLTKDPGISGGFLDSITSLSMSINHANSTHKISKLALIHNDVTECIPVLKYFNYSIISRDIPITFSDIENQKYAEELKNDGCCGILELLKLEVWTLNEYDYILSMDADMLLHQNFDELFEKMSMDNIVNANKLIVNDNEYNGKYLGWTHGATAHLNQELMNGGFLIVRPNITHYNEMYKLIKEGDFRDGSAWKGSGIGWVYGGRSIQGIVPYYYFGVLGKGTHDIEFDRCIFNNMVEIEKCREYKYEEVINNHFTWCQKPWYCVYQTHQPLCIEFNKKWWESSRKVEDLLKLEYRDECPGNKYVAIDYMKSTVLNE